MGDKTSTNSFSSPRNGNSAGSNTSSHTIGRSEQVSSSPGISYTVGRSATPPSPSSAASSHTLDRSDTFSDVSHTLGRSEVGSSSPAPSASSCTLERTKSPPVLSVAGSLLGRNRKMKKEGGEDYREGKGKWIENEERSVEEESESGDEGDDFTRSYREGIRQT
jgi:hypothetical protein